MTEMVKPDRIEFGGKGAVFIDPNADIINDADLLEKFLEWIYEGGNCPIMNNTLNRLVRKFNTYSTSNHDKLTRKNNRKK